MQADINLQAWLESHAGNGMTTIVAYVSAARETDLQYNIRLRNSGQGSSSAVAQSGMVHVGQNQPSQVSTMTVTPVRGGKCEVGLTLREGNAVVGQYTLDCSAK
ncbi:curli-like amyloid fiber formation chaperone CsgH [Cupriavidus pinatubonensis]|uniref:Curli assembly protein CsgC n=1 Tax=Cupriavidus pinatubonensis TaxID=248026 RepID=A0ABN7ZAQ1_9BURK|nr:curli-like amyloid fiber formation chaperone CsgH [Cupriavidus pinatubonensis]CAG9181716.1 hypothetical protein LMG23994_04735 [Cupriavidus pinatubonensis]